MIQIVIITHQAIAAAYRQLAVHFFNEVPEVVSIVEIHRNDTLEHAQEQARLALEKLPKHDGILILTDIFGATPCNVAHKLLNIPGTRLITGLNAPMMIKAMQYASKETDIEQFAQEVKATALAGIMLVEEEEHD